MFVQPVTGTGITPHDNNAFHTLLTRELTAWGGITLVRTIREAEYIVTGTISSSHLQSYSLRLTLLDRNSVNFFEQTLHYQTMEEASEYIPAIVFEIIFRAQANRTNGDGSMQIELLPNVPAVPRPGTVISRPEVPQEQTETTPDITWQNKPWYFSGSLFWAPRLYSSDLRGSGNFANIGLGFYAEYHSINITNEKLSFLKYFSYRTGLEFAPDWIIASHNIGDEYRNLILQIPLLINYVLKPDVFSKHTPYLGIVFNIPLFQYTTVPLLSLKTGFQYGRKIGPGIGFADLSFSFDFGKSGLNKHNENDNRLYNRYMLYLGLGYKYGIGNSSH
jgi:hypothetical protein